MVSGWESAQRFLNSEEGRRYMKEREESSERRKAEQVLRRI